MSKRSSLILFLIVISGLLLIVVSAGAQSSPDARPNPDPAAASGLSFAPSGLPARDALKTADIAGWSRIAYQGLDNDNWDVYIYDSQGSQRLTTDAADDLYPALNRGGTRVAFSSDRFQSDGQLDLFTINIDGSGLNRIFEGWTAFPDWSPDGTEIVFQGWVNDNYEIFVVNADGSNLRRLTTNPDFDGQPTWSPDGHKLVFSSFRNGQYAIYIINADGTNLKKISTYPLSLHPKWSPDGQTIGFDADVDGDGWQEVTQVKVDGTAQQVIFDPGTSATAWAGSWSPDNKFLGFTEISLVQQSGQWVWTEGVLKQWDTNSSIISDLIPGDANWYFDWETLDVIPPVTHINPLNQFSDADSFGLSWSGIDFGGSGLRSYNVFYRPSSTGSWQIFWNNTIATAARFTGVPGETVDFLVRARDFAFNQGVWSKQPVESTTFYKTRIIGSLVDNRGTALGGVPFSIVPAPLQPVVTNVQGQFVGYTALPGAHLISVAQPGYLAMPQTSTVPDADFQRPLSLLPLDTIIQNGTFEASDAAPTSWLTSGVLPISISGDIQATGKNSLRIGDVVQNDADSVAALESRTLSQEVTIPAGMQAPTLAFMVKATGDAAADGSGLEVAIHPDGGSENVIFNAVLPANWRIYWFPVSGYQGQKVQVIFRVTQDTTNPPLVVYLDDISLGSAHPELWLDMSAIPGSAINGDIVTLNIAYGNKGGLDASTAKIEVTLDPNVVYVSANPPATVNGQVLSWEWLALAARSGPNTITVKTLATGTPPTPRIVTAEISSAMTEKLTANNQDQVSIGLKRQIFLPTIPDQN